VIVLHTEGEEGEAVDGVAENHGNLPLQVVRHRHVVRDLQRGQNIIK
jgi:hypothetical protein